MNKHQENFKNAPHVMMWTWIQIQRTVCFLSLRHKALESTRENVRQKKKKTTTIFSVFVCIIWRVVFRTHFQTSTAIPKERTFKLLRLWVGVSGHPLPSPPVKWQLQLAQSQRQSEKILPAAVLEGATSNKMSPYIAKHAAPWCFKWHCNR